jgi:hypothetical protein
MGCDFLIWRISAAAPPVFQTMCFSFSAILADLQHPTSRKFEDRKKQSAPWRKGKHRGREARIHIDAARVFS